MPAARLRVIFYGLSLAALALAGCAASRTFRAHRSDPATVIPCAVVFVADGAGNFQASSAAIRKVAEEDGLPLDIRTFEWSHGYGRVLADQMAYEDNVEHGRLLAEEVLLYHELHPGTRIHLCGHSAGSLIVLKAIETLPPGLVDRLVLLSPSLSVGYDLVPVLERVHCGLHVFYSRHDCYFLGFYMGLLGTSDRRHDACGGRYGFSVDSAPLNPVLRAKLFQRAWQREDRVLGNNGGHFGNYQAAFLRAHVIPLFGE
jgi:pimeloyl-ACP methyl ester carboxylesterase